MGIRSRTRSASLPQRRVALFGLFGVGNHGNEASLAAALGELRRVAPDASPIVVCPAPARVSSDHGVEAIAIAPAGPAATAPGLVRRAARPLVELWRWASAYRFLRTVDLLVVPGTGILDDFGVGPREVPYQLWRWSMAARAARCPLVLLSVGAGPAEHPVSRRLFRATVRLAAACSYRDETSRTFMRSIGHDVSTETVTTDLVFALPLRAASRAGAAGTRPSVGLGVMSYHGWHNDRDHGAAVHRAYLAKLAAFAAAMAHRGLGVRLLVGESTDDDVATGLLRSIEPGGVCYEPVGSLAALVEQIEQTDIVVTSRYHNVVAAMMAGRPVVSIGYADKNRDLLDRVGLGGRCQDIDDFDVDQLVADTMELLTNAGPLGDDLAAAAERFGRASAEQFDSLPWRRSGARPSAGAATAKAAR